MGLKWYCKKKIYNKIRFFLIRYTRFRKVRQDLVQGVREKQREGGVLYFDYYGLDKMISPGRLEILNNGFSNPQI